MTRPLVSIGMPVYSHVCARTMMSLLSTVGGARPFAVHLNFAQGTYLHLVRNKIVEQALATAATHLLFVDADMVFGPDAVTRLLARNVPIVGVTYNKRTFPIESTIKLLDNTTTELTLPDEPFKVAGLGTGLLLVQMGVFRALPEPWFDYDRQADGEFVGEDILFCRRARALGYDIWCDPTIDVGHVGEYIF